MFDILKELFHRPVWKEVNMEFLRHEKQYDSALFCYDEFDVYAVTYKDLKSDRTKIEERYILL